MLLSTAAIEQEQQYLSKEMETLNNEYVSLLKNINLCPNTKNLKKSRQTNFSDRSS
jgi:hypothetical protein